MNKMYKYVAAIALMMVSINFAFAQTIKQPYHDVVEVVTKIKLLVEQDAQKAFKSINEGGLTTPYPFVLDMDLITIAHGYTPDNVGAKNMGNVDSNGKAYVDIMRTKAIKNGSGWVSYRYENPATGKEGDKLSYFEVAKGSDGKNYIVGSGMYTD